MGFMNWSLKIGRIFGITVRLHLTLLIILAVEFFQWTFVSGGPLGLLWFLIEGAILFLIILLHEFGHCFAARSVGGEADEVLLWPLGGLAFVRAPNTPRAQMKTALGGPAVNVLIGLGLGLILLVLSLPVRLSFTGWYMPSGGHLGYWFGFWIRHAFSINLIVLMFNLLPAFPMDGGRILQCFLWPKIGFADSTLKAISFGNICAVGLGIIGIVWNNILMVVIALFIYMEGARVKMMIQAGMLQDESVFGYDFSQGYTSFEASEEQYEAKEPGFFQRWAERRRQRKLEREQKKAEDIESRVDRLLDKVSQGGLHSLTDSEKDFLKKASKRYKR